MQSYLEKMQKFYDALPLELQRARQHFNRPLTYAEKILYLHAITDQCDFEKVSSSYRFDHVAMHDGVAQIVMLQFAVCGKKSPAVTTSLHCDRLIVAENGAERDLAHAYEEYEEIFHYLQSVSEKFGCEFWKPGSGMMLHQLCETHAFPGEMILGTDPCVSYLGGLGVLAFEGSGVESLDAMIGLPFEINLPKIFGVYLTGHLQGWTSPKDVGLKLLAMLSGKAMKGAIIEFFGPGTETLSSAGKSTICSLSSQLGAMSAIFPYDGSMLEFLNATHRSPFGDLVERVKSHLCADPEVLKNPQEYFEEVFEIQLSQVSPSMIGPHVTDRLHVLGELPHFLNQQNYPEKLALGLIGSCTNASYEDLKKVAILARQALKHGLRVKAPLLISVGSEKILDALKHEGFLQILEDVGATILSSACGPCIGQWKRSDVAFGEKNMIVTSFNSNAPGHCDANPGTHAFVSSPEVVMASALAGTLNFNPATETLMNAQGLPVRLNIPQKKYFPENGFAPDLFGHVLPPKDEASVQVYIDPMSERLQEFESFKPFLEKAFLDLRLLVKVEGKCTSDQMSPAGKWMKFRGHLENISNHLFSMVPNYFRDEIGKGKNLLNNCIEPFAKIARDYKKEEIGWIAVGSENYGEGPVREHTPLEIRYLGGRAVIAKSFAVPYEQNLKKHGILVLTFVRPEDSGKIREDDWIDLLGVSQLAVESSLELCLKHADGTTDRIPLTHNYTQQQISWFKAGSVLNAV
ncbi:MAG: aconitase family protein [Parachlamydiaceae bacterium]